MHSLIFGRVYLLFRRVDLIIALNCIRPTRNTYSSQGEKASLSSLSPSLSLSPLSFSLSSLSPHAVSLPDSPWFNFRQISFSLLFSQMTKMCHLASVLSSRKREDFFSTFVVSPPLANVPSDRERGMRERKKYHRRWEKKGEKSRLMQTKTRPEWLSLWLLLLCS